MSWVQIGKYKIHTLQISFAELEGETVRLHFAVPAGTLELKGDDARLMWRYLKADNPGAGPEKGSTMVLPRLAAATLGSSDKPRPSAAPVPPLPPSK